MGSQRQKRQKNPNMSSHTPISTHRELEEQRAAAGSHVFCGKPMAHTLEDPLATERACQSHAVKSCDGSSFRHLPAMIEARRLICAGAVGSVTLLVEEVTAGEGRAAFRSLSPTHYLTGGPGGGGYGIVDGIHMLDALPWLRDSSISTVFGRGDRTGDIAYPESTILGRTSGAVGVLLYGSKGSLRIFHYANRLC